MVSSAFLYLPSHAELITAPLLTFGQHVEVLFEDDVWKDPKTNMYRGAWANQRELACQYITYGTDIMRCHSYLCTVP